MSLKSFIQSLQAKPYRQRMRILWLVSATAAVILFFIWAGLIKIQNAEFSGQTLNFFGDFTNFFDKAKAQITQFKDSSTATAPEVELTLKKFNLNNANKTLTVIFSVKNKSTDILNFLQPNLANITLADGKNTLSPQQITQTDGTAFPKRILTAADVTGQLIFPLPQEKIVTLSISNLSFLTTPDKTFNKTLVLDLSSPNVQNILQSQNPRD